MKKFCKKMRKNLHISKKKCNFVPRFFIKIKFSIYPREVAGSARDEYASDWVGIKRKVTDNMDNNNNAPQYDDSEDWWLYGY